MYKSPIEIIYSGLQTQLEGEVMRAVQSVDVNVDKDELIKALAYDRQQYEKGYADAKKEYQRPTGRWVYDDGNLEWACSECLRAAHVNFGAICGYVLSDFCPNCGAKMEG